jgi:hypothetical protein
MQCTDSKAIATARDKDRRGRQEPGAACYASELSWKKKERRLPCVWLEKINVDSSQSDAGNTRIQRAPTQKGAMDILRPHKSNQIQLYLLIISLIVCKQSNTPIRLGLEFGLCLALAFLASSHKIFCVRDDAKNIGG